jgi:hypothetical protein
LYRITVPPENGPEGPKHVVVGNKEKHNQKPKLRRWYYSAIELHTTQNDVKNEILTAVFTN